MSPETEKPSETVIPVPLPTKVGTLPAEYKRMSASRNQPTPPPSNKLYMLIPMLICISLLWFAYSQWHHPPQVLQRPVKAEDPNVKKRVWWMPDLLKTLPPFADGYRAEKYVEKYNLTSCYINGNFPEVNAAIFCYLFDSEKYKNQSISEDLKHPGLCGGNAPLTLTNWDQWRKLWDINVRRIAIVQQPLERFARQFRRHCEIDKKCFDCKDSIACFMRKILKEHQKLAEGLQGPVRTFLSNNFSPQSWNCHFNRDFHIIKALKIGGNETEKVEFADSLNLVLDEQGVDKEKQRVIKEEILKLNLKLTEPVLKIMKTVRQDEDLWRLFRYLYEHDYYIFGYKLE